MAISAREAAFRALSSYRRSGAWSDSYLNNLIKREGLEAREAALATRLCAGVLQNRALLDFWLSGFSSMPLSKLQPQTLDILELSAYQLAFMDRIPASAAASQGVELAKKHCNAKAAGFVNAVLRSFCSKLGSLPEFKGGSVAETLSVRFSHPLPLVKMLLGFMNERDCEDFLRANNEILPITAQVNTLKTDLGAAVERLGREGAEAEPHPWMPDCLLLHGAPERLAAFSDGDITVQDVSARLSVIAACPKEGSELLDACAAPGGKSFAAAMMMKNNGSIIACDINENKLERIDSGAQRLGINIIRTMPMDASRFSPPMEGRFDVVIADVPCSGLGVIRKKPEIRYKKPEEIAGLPDIQLAILKNVSRYVKPGGILLYSTCTVLSAENEGVINAFLKENKAFATEDFTLPHIGLCRGGSLTLWPQTHGTDGFFICKMRKVR